MATYDLVFNVAKGKVARYAQLPSTNDALIAIPLETAGIVAAATMKDYDTVADILAGATNEQTANMTRKTLTSVTVTPDDTNDWMDVDSDDIIWDDATGNAISAFLIAYDPDTTGGTDADLVPLVIFDLVVTPSGGDITYQFPAGGWYRAT